MGEFVVENKRDSRTGIITHTVDVGDGKLEYRRYRAISAGLAWPGAGHGAHYLVLGEMSVNEKVTRFEGVEPPRGKLVVLCERSVDSPFLIELAEHLTDDCSRFGCDGVYGEIELSEDGSFRDDRANLFRDRLQNAKCSASLQRAPYTAGSATGPSRMEALRLALSIVELWLKEGKLELPEGSVALEQLRAITKEDLHDPEAEPRLYAARALGHVVSVFHKDNPYGLAGRFIPKRRHRVPRHTARPR